MSFSTPTRREGRLRAVMAVVILLVGITSASTAFAAADWCPSDHEALVKFEWETQDEVGSFVPEGGDAKGVTVTASEFKEENGVPDTLDPVAASWTSQVPIDLVLVKAAGDVDATEYDDAHEGEVWSPNGHGISYVAFCYQDDAPPPVLGLTLDKLNDANGDGVFSDVEDVSGAGKAVTFQVTVTNTSDVDLTVTSLTDTMLDTTLDLLEAPYCPDLDGLTLEPQGSETCTFTLDRYLHTYGPTPRTHLTNVVEIVATAGEEELEDEDGSTVVNPNAGQISVDVDKSNDGDGDQVFTDDERAPEPGADVTFQVVVSNTSPGSVIITELTDTWPGLDQPVDLFAHCPDLEGKKLWGIGGGGDGDDDGHEDDHHTSGVVALAEDGGHDGGHDRPTSATCTFTLEGYAPAAGGSLTDTVTVTVGKRHSPDQTATASDTSTVTTAAEQAAANPAIELEKRIGLSQTGPFADHDDPPGLNVSIPPGGASVWYELEVTNTGDATLTDITLEDTPVDVSSCVIPVELAPAATFDCVVGSVAAEVGDHANEATVTATGAGRTVDATDEAHYRGAAVAPAVLERPAVTLRKSADITPVADGVKYVRYDPRDADEETVTYVFEVINNGETALSDLTLTDDRIGAITLPGTTLPVGGTMTVRATEVVSEVEAAAGTIRNTATVRGVAPDGTAVSDEATEEVAVVEVQPAVIPRPPMPAPQPAPLPRTGADVVLLGALALASITSGTLLLVARRRA